ncbi:MAG: ribosome hibernation-promoting factor, HPF/YfiA family [Acidimicrobiales bacterium]
MDVIVHSRNIQLADSVREAAVEKVSRLSRFLEGMDHAEVNFSEERNPRISEREVCEVTMAGHGHLIRARAASSDPLASVDRVVDKLEHQIEKLKGKLLGRSHPRRHASVDSGGQADRDTEDEDASRNGPRIVKTKQFAIKPMTPEEAALQMDLLGHDFYFFTNAETELAALVYRRNDGNVGLIDAS